MKNVRVDTTYHRPDGTMQPTASAKLSKSGELIWTSVPKAPWHLKMIPNRYDGDFAVEWMWLSLFNKGFDWENA